MSRKLSTRWSRPCSFTLATVFTMVMVSPLPLRSRRSALSMRSPWSVIGQEPTFSGQMKQ